MKIIHCAIKRFIYISTHLIRVFIISVTSPHILIKCISPKICWRAFNYIIHFFTINILPFKPVISQNIILIILKLLRVVLYKLLLLLLLLLLKRQLLLLYLYRIRIWKLWWRVRVYRAFLGRALLNLSRLHLLLNIWLFFKAAI